MELEAEPAPEAPSAASSEATPPSAVKVAAAVTVYSADMLIPTLRSCQNVLRLMLTNCSVLPDPHKKTVRDVFTKVCIVWNGVIVVVLMLVSVISQIKAQYSRLGQEPTYHRR